MCSCAARKPYDADVRERVTVRLPDGLALGLAALAQRSGKAKSKIVRDALAKAGISMQRDPENRAEALRRAAAFRARQTRVVDTAALVRESREALNRRHEHKISRAKPRGRWKRVPPRRVTDGFQENPLT